MKLNFADKIFKDLIDAGADVVTTGNHVWDEQETLDFIPKLSPDNVIFSIFTPYPGSDMFYQCKDMGIIDNDYDVLWSSSYCVIIIVIIIVINAPGEHSWIYNSSNYSSVLLGQLGVHLLHRYGIWW